LVARRILKKRRIASALSHHCHNQFTYASEEIDSNVIIVTVILVIRRILIVVPRMYGEVEDGI